VKLFRGLQQTDYQDVLRAVGRFADERGFRDLRLIEHEDGLVVQGLPMVNGQPVSYRYETYLLTDEEIQALLRRSYRHRGTGELGSTPRTLP
jgi:hypothetical protein